jgi:hypothetical protein
MGAGEVGWWFISNLVYAGTAGGGVAVGEALGGAYK